MKHAAAWIATKVVRNNGRFFPTSDPKELAIASRIISAQQINAYWEAIRLNASGRLLDMGCGKVPYYEMYRDLVSETVCVDWEHSPHGNPFTDYAVDLNKSLPIEDESFDTVLLTDVLEHIQEPSNLVREIARVLTPKGTVIIGVPFFYWLHETPHDYYRYTEFALIAFATNNKLEVLSVKPYGGVPEIVCDISAKCLNGIGMKTTCAAFSFAAQKLLGTGLVKKLSSRTSSTFPLGYVMVARRNG